VFSFYPTKNLTTGEGGALVTNREEVAVAARMLRNHGQKDRYEYGMLGYNYRMTDLAAAIGLAQTKKLDLFTRLRINNARVLNELLEPYKTVETPYVMPNCKHVYNQYTIVVKKETRDKLAIRLMEEGIGTGVYYPKPLHLSHHLAFLGYKPGDFPVTEKICQKVLSLPVHPSITKDTLHVIARVVKEVTS
jgi:perosamine synthetase